jgi:serine/threonine protein phosphatase 1
MEKRILVTSDPHGCYDEFMFGLERAKYDPARDQLILLGDYIDRGPKSRQVVAECMKLQKEHGAICLIGNHEEMMLGTFTEGPFQQIYQHAWLENGGYETLSSYNYNDHLTDELIEHLTWFASLPLYYETEDYIFTHASPAPEIPMSEQDPGDLLWSRHYNEVGLGKLVVHGHTPRRRVTQYHDQLFIDTGGVFGNKFTIIELPSRRVFEVSGYRKGVA